MALTTLPRLNGRIAITAKGDTAGSAFTSFWDQFAKAIEGNEAAQAATIAQIQGILAGEGQFSAINLNGTTLLNFGTAASANIGTSGAAVPLLNGTNEWADEQTFDAAPNSATGYQVAGVKVLGAQVTGWTPSTGTDNQGAFDADQTRVLGAAYVQADAQATQDDLLAARQRIKALEDAMRSHGLID